MPILCGSEPVLFSSLSGLPLFTAQTRLRSRHFRQLGRVLMLAQHRLSLSCHGVPCIRRYSRLPSTCMSGCSDSCHRPREMRLDAKLYSDRLILCPLKSPLRRCHNACLHHRDMRWVPAGLSRGSALTLGRLVGVKTALSSTSLRCCGHIYNSDEALDAGPLQGQLKAANKSNYDAWFSRGGGKVASRLWCRTLSRGAGRLVQMAIHRDHEREFTYVVSIPSRCYARLASSCRSSIDSFLQRARQTGCSSLHIGDGPDRIRLFHPKSMVDDQ